MNLSFQHAYSIVMQLQQAGYLAYFVGGWVRDFIMQHPSEDIDIVTDATSNEISALFSQTLLVGLSFGVVIVKIEEYTFEVATFRKDLSYKDGRHPQAIEFCTPQEDAWRRDFTVNGMFYDPVTETIHDYVEGQKDIHNRIIRAIGNPKERFFEDRLRLLRAFRFAARLGFSIDLNTLKAIEENVCYLFPAVAKERVWQEFTKMSSYPCFDQALIGMHKINLLQEIFPELKKLPLNELQHLVKAFTDFPSRCPTILYVMELFPNFSMNQKFEVAKRLTVSNKEIKWMELMDQFNHLFQEEKRGKVDLQKWVHALAHPHAFICLQILGARLPLVERKKWCLKIDQRREELSIHIHRLHTGQPLISAAFLQLHGIQPGIKMGRLLKESEELAIKENLDDPSFILEKLRQTNKL